MFRQPVRKKNQLWPYRKGKVNPLLKKGEGFIVYNKQLEVFYK